MRTFMPLRSLWLPLLLACAASGAQADVCRAAPGGAGDGATWAQPMALQTALNTASCTEIWLKQGLYKPGTQRLDTFNIPRPLHLYGGFAGNEAERNQRAANSRLTVLSGDIDNNDTATDNIVLGTSGIAGGNSYHVLRINQAGAAIAFTPANTVIDGLTITGGQADGSGWEGDGAGLLCLAVNANRECSPRIANVTFSGNLAANSGGGMYTFAKDDGKSSPEITHSTFSGNTVGWYGGGLTVDIVILSNATGSPSIAHSTFSGNAATGTNTLGGAVHLVGATAVSVAHVTFANNTSSNFGGALHAQDGTQATITASIFWGNTASNGTQISLKGASTNLGDLTGSLVQGGSGGVYAWGGALFSGNPYVSDPHLDVLQDNGGSTWTMLPPVGSQAADKANCAAGQTDQRGAARPTVAGACDLGAVERMETIPYLSVAFTPSTDQVRQIALNWAASSESVYYSVTRVSNGATVCQTASTACLLTGLPDGDSVDFNLTGYSDFGSSVLGTASGQTLALPGTPQSFTATSGEAQKSTLQWQGGSGGAATGYTVTRADTSAVVCDHVATLGCTVTGLDNGTAYTFHVVAHNAAGDGTGHASASATTLALPATPANFTATPGLGIVTLAWDAAAGASRYIVTNTTGGGSDVVCDVATLGCTVPGLADGAAYTFALVAHNAAGDSGAATASGGTFGVPTAPGTVTATAGAGRAILTWTAPSDDGGSPITAYSVSGSPAGSCAPGLALACTISGLASGVPHTFTVRAVNAVGQGAGATALATPYTLPPPPPAEISINGPGTYPITDPSLPVVIGPGADGAVLVLPGSGTTPVPVSVVIGGQALEVRALPGTQLQVARVDGQSVLVLVVLQGWAEMTASNPNQPMVLAGGTLLRSGAAGTKVEAVPLATGVLAGSLLPPAGAVPQLNERGLLAGEWLQVDKNGAITTVALGTVTPGVRLGNPAPLPALGDHVTLAAPLAQWQGPVTRLGLETWLQVLGSHADGAAATAEGGVHLQLDAWTLPLWPQVPVRIDVREPDGATLTPEGLVQVVRKGLVLTLAPTLADWPAFVQSLNAPVQVSPEGVLSVTLNGHTWIFRPAMLADPHGLEGFGADEDGTIRFGRQRLLPALADYAAARALLLQALPGAQVGAMLHPEGALAVNLGAAGRWLLRPDAQLLGAQVGPQDQPWWLGADGALYLRLSGAVQRVWAAPAD